MTRNVVIVAGLAIAAALPPVGGCSNLPGTKKEQGAVIGGVGGAAAGAAVAKNNRLLGALIGGALGAGGGYLIGAQMEKVKNHDQQGAVQASQKAQSNPVTPEQARNATTADVNGDGFVTLDEVIAMKKAGFSDQDMLQRLRATNQVFELTPQQEQILRDNGVSDYVITQLRTLNQTAPTTGQDQVISHQK